MIPDLKKYRKISLLLMLMNCWQFCFAQQQWFDSIAPKFNQFQSKSFNEKIYIHTDKDFYITGEIVWFKIYSVEASGNTLSEISKVAYVEILNSDNKPVLQSKINMVNGMGNGSFTLPNSLQSGSFTLRAYTNWMKNSDPDYFFSKNLTIVNSLKKPNWLQQQENTLETIQYFPEGGNLVYGLESKVAFKITNKSGEGIEGAGVLVNEDNDTLLHFNTHVFGMGNFIFTPLAGHQYKLIAHTKNNQLLSCDISKIYSDGYVMKLLPNENNQLNILIEANAQEENKQLYIIAFSQQKIKFSKHATIIKGKAGITINKDSLADGISVITAFNEQRQPICERLVFKTPLKKLSIDLNTDKKIYDTREKVIIKLEAKNNSGYEAVSYLSSSVILTDSLQKAGSSSIFDYVYLSSDLKGYIESPEFYFKEKNATTELALDNLLLTQGWRRFEWSKIINNNKPVFNFLPEYEGPVIQATLINKATLHPVKDSMVYASIADTSFYFSSAVANQDGQLYFNARNIYGINKVIFTNAGNNGLKLEFSNPFSTATGSKRTLPFSIDATLGNQLSKHVFDVGVFNSFRNESKATYSVSGNIRSEAFYGRPDATYLLDDYTRFKTMEEVFREFIPEVRVRKENQLFYFRVQHSIWKNFFDQAPLILLDGIPMFDMNKFMETDPLKIKKIEVMTNNYFLGPSVNNGIVSCISYDGNIAGYELDKNAVIVNYEGLQVQREFYVPVYESVSQKNNRTADYRNVLYWNPDIKTNSGGTHEFSFYTSDIPGIYTIMLQGISNDGSVGSNTLQFQVKEKK